GDQVEALLRDAIAMQPESACAHAALGNVLGRAARFDESFEAYARALELDPNNARLHLGLGERLRLHNRDGLAERHLSEALSLERVYEEQGGASPDIVVVALFAPGFWESQLPIDLLVDREQVGVIKVYVGGDVDLNAWPKAILLNAIADPDQSVAIGDAQRLVDGSDRKCLNPPDLLARTDRMFLSELERTPENVTVPRTIRGSAVQLRQDADSLQYPMIIRPIGSHRGEQLERIGDRNDLLSYLGTASDEAFHCTQFVDYRSSDGFFRKYRFIFIEGKPYPYHLAISPQWMVHYFSAPMAEHAWMREEEARFLAAPFDLFSGALQTALESLAGILELDYFGVDCAIHEGKLLIFEANANMLVHGFDDRSLFGYKQHTVAKIRAAFNAMLRQSLL
ncbi:MAG: tetratricopeptide repeat protein, partial [Candidatus Eremiobacteraeota bacterium]|nr:tetratricopeptide repeat protein [Candidatus Eremiobacteraeota bacterium]